MGLHPSASPPGVDDAPARTSSDGLDAAYMTARQNYGFERRRRDQLRRAKQEEKRLRKTERTEAGETGPEMGEAPATAAPEGVWEWFSPSRSRTATTATGSRPAPEEPDDWVLLTETAEEPES